MVSHVADVVRRGIWASLTGGWFYDSSLDLVSNIIHLYLWTSLLIAPFLLYILFEPSWMVWGIYLGVLLVVFTLLKVGNHLMHGFFDTHQSENGGKNGQGNDTSSHGSLESLSEHLAAFCTDPDVLADWRRLHPRHRQSLRARDPATDEIPLRSLNSAAVSSTVVEGRSKASSTEMVAMLSPSSWEKISIDPQSSGENGEKAATCDSPVQNLDGSETVNFKVDVHIHPPTTKVENPVDSDSSKEGDSLLVPDGAVRAKRSLDAPTSSNAEASDSETYDKFTSATPVDPRRSPIPRQASAGQLSRLQRRPAVRANKNRPHRESSSNNDNSVTSVLNQPTTSMEQILSTFRMPSRNTSAEPVLSDESLPQLSPKGLRRAKSEFYTGSGYGTSHSSRMISDPSLAAPTEGTQRLQTDSAPDGSTDFEQVRSTPNLGQNESEPVDPKEDLKISVDEKPVMMDKTELAVDNGEYPPEYVFLGPSTSGLEHRRTSVVSERPAGHTVDFSSGSRPPPFGLSELNAAEQLLRDEEQGLLDSPAFRPEPQLEPCQLTLEESELLGNIMRNQRPIRASSLFRREREQRALMRAESPDARARLESFTNSRGLLETLQSWLSGTSNPATRPSDPEVPWPPSFAERTTHSRTASHVDSHVDDELPGNRYSPQTSIVSSDIRNDLEQPGPSRLTAVDSGALSTQRRRYTVLQNPLWHDDGNDEATRDNRLQVVTGTRPSTNTRETPWLSEPSANERAAMQALLRACSNRDEKASTEHRLGPVSWRELFGDERRSPKVRFQRPLYKIPICPWSKEPKHISIHLDRLSLMALFDRTRSVWECVLAVIMCGCVGAAGGLLLAKGFYHDLWAFALCFVMAGCQYSLVKSVQPDSASPTHGFNRVAVYSRSVYFCLLSGLILLLDLLVSYHEQHAAFSLFGFHIIATGVLVFFRNALTIILLCFPMVFAYGLLPHINTFPVYLLEQIDIHVFGGSATCGLISSVYAVTRSCVAIVALHGICYAALEDRAARGMMELNLSFSLFCGLLVALGYHLSRSSSDPVVLWNVVRKIFKKGDCQSWTPEIESKTSLDLDLVQERIEMTVYDRLRSDVILCPIFVMIFFGLQGSKLFSINVLLTDVLIALTVGIGLILSYVVPKLRAQMPWLCFSKPFVPSYKTPHRIRSLDNQPPQATIFESICLWLRIIERNVLYPCILLGVLTNQTVTVSNKFGPYLASVLVTICGLKYLRLAYGDAENQYLILAFTSLFFRFDAAHRSETFLLDYFVVSFLYYKLSEWLLKWKFVMTYIAPWQITWGSAFHAFAQPFSIPHSGMLLMQTIISTLIASPLNPFLGSAIFLTSYPRPIKFWEKNYKTRRLDHSNTRLDAQLDGHSGNDDNNLNSIFYEHLTHSLQKSLCGDIMMGKWGNVSCGDFFILASDYLNCLVHIIEIGNGLVTFQVRGLEFRGTYCQQREVEAITENVDENRGFCCCEPGHLPHMLSLNAAFNQRWLAWQVFAGRYILQGYSVSDNNASTMFQIYDLRKILVTFYVKCIIFYLLKHPRVLQWLIYTEKEIASVHNLDYYDLDPLFVSNIDMDFDIRYHGISRHAFYLALESWIEYCVGHSEYRDLDISEPSAFMTLAFAMSICGRRVLGAAAQLSLHSVDWFLHGLHALFKGDFRINCPRDEWVFTDIDLLHKVIAPAIRMALKLHQDHFTAPDEYERNEALYAAILEHETNMVICHEGDPKWRQAVLANTPSLLALRHVVDDNRDDYKVIMLDIRNLDFRLIKINRECVRGFWAGQLQELVFFRNRNPERGSIQNAKQALRNMINSSCDQPIGYPIYVSPLTTSYADTHNNLCRVVGGPVTVEAIRDVARHVWEDVRDRCYASCSGSSGAPRIARPREAPIVVSYNPQQGQRPIEFTRRPET
ncbi:pecanex-like protein 1 isoform X2 [Paramacrobiotus metropolitanus]|uniref:pecanex-like protein 1 isoform X2 n=1 Tax=Paramacrobiotus metropolitanus TaxID=2943436 RepID=UPI0024459D83|nr:pecanex-like protein 1 isoform X2 [Paramacrobiotus metropolitanus]